MKKNSLSAYFLLHPIVWFPACIQGQAAYINASPASCRNDDFPRSDVFKIRRTLAGTGVNPILKSNYFLNLLIGKI